MVAHTHTHMFLSCWEILFFCSPSVHLFVTLLLGATRIHPFDLSIDTDASVSAQIVKEWTHVCNKYIGNE